MSNVIQQLKDNEKPYGLMSEEMQDWMKQVNPKHLECLQSCIPEAWMGCDIGIDWTTPTNLSTCTFRLRSDYTDEPEIVECEIQKDGLGKFHYNRPDGITNCSLSTAVNYSDFIGFKFADGTVMGSPVKYSVPGITSHGYWASYEDLKTKQALEHHACHVLFRRKKQE